MGRPLIYVCAILIGVMGMIQISLNNRHLALTKRTAYYADELEMRNLAHSGIDLTLNELRKNPSWRNNYQPYEVPLDYGSAYVTIEDNTTNASLDSDHLRLISKVPFWNDSVLVAYITEIAYPKLPSIPGALTLTDGQFEPNLYGSFDINGNDESGVDSVGIPGIAVADQESKDKIIDSSSQSVLDQIVGSTGTPSIEVDQSVSFNDMSYLIALLAPNATYLNGQYTSNIGSPENPGVFFVENYAKITGNSNGYGILVVKQSGDLDFTTLDVKGTFNFYGLVLFENSWAFNGNGTATIHGSVLVGSPDEAAPINIELGGNLNLQYNKTALTFAEEAAKITVPPTFNIKEVYE